MGLYLALLVTMLIVDNTLTDRELAQGDLVDLGRQAFRVVQVFLVHLVVHQGRDNQVHHVIPALDRNTAHNFDLGSKGRLHNPVVVLVVLVVLVLELGVMLLMWLEFFKLR